ncbi:MAG TPA: glycoside hydrolase family 30 beta sandwich domain-containing protein [Bacteroidales bacterium]|nr:glycoside hydrolase family 30 beta sandwich domain-containing protein [Bacteroidales bacterium]
MKTITLLIFAGILLFYGCNESSYQVDEWRQSTDNETWIKQDWVQQHDTENIQTFLIDPTRSQQTIDGFGGCFNELGWDALKIVDSAEREAVLQELFAPNVGGVEFTICRMPIGANDFARDFYSLNETQGDFAMDSFNVERDKTSLIPYIKSAMAYNPDLKVWGSPWSPPVWMKTNNHYACRSAPVNDLPEDRQGEENVTQFIMEPEYLEAYALYFSKYVEAYHNEGIPVYAVHVQNEPNSCQNFPSCIWAGQDLGRFIAGHLGPKFKETHPDVEIWLGTIERPDIERVAAVLENTNARQYIKGVGFQWAGRGAIPFVNLAYPHLKLMQTETECGNGWLPWSENAQNDWEALEYTFHLMEHYFSHGANSYLYWNMVLDETGKSTWSWKQNSMITIHSETGEVTYNPEFYLMKHFSHYIKPGAVKLDVKNQGQFLAFKNPDNSIVIQYYNSLNEEDTVQFRIDEKEITFKLKPKSLNTLVLKNTD